MRIYEIIQPSLLEDRTASLRNRYKPLKRMRDILNEVPMVDYQPLGNFDKPGPFRGIDKKLVPHPKNRLKAERFFKKAPYDFRLFFSNISGTGQYSEYGLMDPQTVKIIFDKDGEDIVKGHEDAITIIFVGNKGADKRMLSPWIMAHRFGHAIVAGSRRNRNASNAWKEAEQHFFGNINQILHDFYGDSSKPSSEFKFELRKEYNALFNAIGTQRSSREGQIRRPYEFLYELFAQYLNKGSIELKPLPMTISYGQKAWGKPTRLMSVQSVDLRYETERRHATELLARDMEIMFNDVLRDTVGKIYVI
jgi:hypothetical protein